MSDVKDFYSRFSLDKTPDRHVNTITSQIEFKGDSSQRIALGKRLASLSVIQREAFEKLYKSRVRYGVW